MAFGVGYNNIRPQRNRMSSLVLVKVTEWTTYGIGTTDGHEKVYVCEELFRPLHPGEGQLVFQERHTVKLNGQRKNHFRMPTPESDILVANLEVGPNGRIYASQWNFLTDYNRIAKRRGFPLLQVESAQSGEMMVAAG